MIKNILFVITIILVALLCVRACVGVNESISVVQVLDYLANAPHASETLSDVIHRFDSISAWFSEYNDELQETINDTFTTTWRRTQAKISQFVNNIVQVVVFAVFGCYQLIPIGYAVILDMAYILRIFNYLIFAIPL